MYTKTITVYGKNERYNMHRKGIWVDRDGNLLPVCQMKYDRLEKLVRMLATWAMSEEDPMLYLRNHPIFIHILNRIISLNMNTYHASMFLLASRVFYV